MPAIAFPTHPTRLDYTATPWTDPSGTDWLWSESKLRWRAEVSAGGGASTFEELTDKATADLPAINGPLGDVLALKAPLASPTFTTPALGVATATSIGVSGSITAIENITAVGNIEATGNISTNSQIIGYDITAANGFSGPGPDITDLDAGNISTGNIARARIDNALSANAAPIVATTVTASGIVKAGTGTNTNISYGSSGLTSGFTIHDTAWTSIVSSGQYACTFGRGANWRIRNDTGIGWTSNNAGPNDTPDVALRRYGVNELMVNDGSNSATNPGDFRVRNLTASGTLAVTGNGTMGNFKRGAGSPESVVTGSVGDIYTRTDGGASTTLYVKESGSATNTGWIAK